MNEIVEYTYIGREWDAHHGVWQMLIKRGKESEAMLTGQVDTSSGAGVGNINAPRLASEDVAALKHGDRKSALDQLMCGAKTANATA